MFSGVEYTFAPVQKDPKQAEHKKKENPPKKDAGKIPLNQKVIRMESRELEQIPSEVYGRDLLSALYLSRNRITQIGGAVSTLVNLKKLDLSHNQLTSVPAELGAVTCLEVLLLDSNQLTELPSQIAHLINLRISNLSDNPLGDELRAVWEEPIFPSPFNPQARRTLAVQELLSLGLPEEEQAARRALLTKKMKREAAGDLTLAITRADVDHISAALEAAKAQGVTGSAITQGQMFRETAQDLRDAAESKDAHRITEAMAKWKALQRSGEEGGGKGSGSGNKQPAPSWGPAPVKPSPYQAVSPSGRNSSPTKTKGEDNGNSGESGMGADWDLAAAVLKDIRLQDTFNRNPIKGHLEDSGAVGSSDRDAWTSAAGIYGIHVKKGVAGRDDCSRKAHGGQLSREKRDGKFEEWAMQKKAEKDKEQEELRAARKEWQKQIKQKQVKDTVQERREQGWQDITHTSHSVLGPKPVRHNMKSKYSKGQKGDDDKKLLLADRLEDEGDEAIVMVKVIDDSKEN